MVQCRRAKPGRRRAGPSPWCSPSRRQDKHMTDIKDRIETLKQEVQRRASPSPRGAHALNAKQESFVQGTLRGLNGVAAAREAGYTGSEATLASVASKLLKVHK